MGLEPTTFCMAISSSTHDFQQRCGFVVRTDAVGLRRLPGIRTVIRQSDGSPMLASECVSTRSLDGAKRPCARIGRGALAGRPLQQRPPGARALLLLPRSDSDLLRSRARTCSDRGRVDRPPPQIQRTGRTTSIPRLETRWSKSSAKRWMCSVACCSKFSTLTISAIST